MNTRKVNSISQARAALADVEALSLQVLLWAHEQRQRGGAYPSEDLASVEDRADTISSKATVLRRHLEKMKRGK